MPTLDESGEPKLSVPNVGQNATLIFGESIFRTFPKAACDGNIAACATDSTLRVVSIGDTRPTSANLDSAVVKVNLGLQAWRFLPAKLEVEEGRVVLAYHGKTSAYAHKVAFRILTASD